MPPTVLFTVAEFKEAEGIRTAAHDAMLANLEAQVRAAVDRYCRRSILGVDGIVEDIDGDGTGEVVVGQPPIRVFTELRVDDHDDLSASTPVASTDYVVDKVAGIVKLLPTASFLLLGGASPLFPPGVQNVRVSYDGGFDPVPEDLKRAAIMLGGAWLVRRRKGGLQASTISGTTLSFQSSGIPAEVAEILRPYRLYPTFGLVRVSP